MSWPKLNFFSYFWQQANLHRCNGVGASRQRSSYKCYRHWAGMPSVYSFQVWKIASLRRGCGWLMDLIQPLVWALSHTDIQPNIADLHASIFPIQLRFMKDLLDSFLKRKVNGLWKYKDRIWSLCAPSKTLYLKDKRDNTSGCWKWRPHKLRISDTYHCRCWHGLPWPSCVLCTYPSWLYWSRIDPSQRHSLPTCCTTAKQIF